MLRDNTNALLNLLTFRNPHHLLNFMQPTILPQTINEISKWLGQQQPTLRLLILRNLVILFRWTLASSSSVVCRSAPKNRRCEKRLLTLVGKHRMHLKEGNLTRKMCPNESYEEVHCGPVPLDFILDCWRVTRAYSQDCDAPFFFNDMHWNYLPFQLVPTKAWLLFFLVTLFFRVYPKSCAPGISFPSTDRCAAL